MAARAADVMAPTLEQLIRELPQEKLAQYKLLKSFVGKEGWIWGEIKIHGDSKIADLTAKI